MRRVGWVLLAVVSAGYVLASTTAGASGGSSVTIRVKPAIGSRSTRFTVSFRAPQQTASTRTGGSRYELSASGRSGRGCASNASTVLGPTRKGELVEVRLAPPAPSHLWCPRRYSGRLIEILTPECGPRELCPAFIAMMDVGEFSFRVR